MNSLSLKALVRFLAIAFAVVTVVWLVQRGPTFSFITGGATLSGNTPDVLGESQIVKHADPETRMEILVGLKVRDEADLDTLLVEQQNPNSPQYQQFLTTDQFIARFSPATQDVDETVRYLTSQGLKIKSVPRNRLMIHAEGTVAQLEKAFNVTINEYSVDGPAFNESGVLPADTTKAKIYFSNDRDPVIPIHLKNVVESVIGLNTYAQMESRMMEPKGPVRRVLAPAHTPQDIATAYNFPNGNNKRLAAPVVTVSNPVVTPVVTPVNTGTAPVTAPVSAPVSPPASAPVSPPVTAPVTPDPTAPVATAPVGMASRADSMATPSQKVYSGKGVKVAVATAYGYDPKDIEAYWKKHNIVRTGKLIDRPINGLSGKLEGETTLDLELVSSQVPDADVLMYIAVNPSFLNFALTFNQVAIDNEASVMTVSWGLCERGTGWLMMKTENMVFKQLAAQGVALFVSSGDDGAYDCKAKSKGKEPPNWAVDYPASNPHFTAVGGTSLSQHNGVRTSEPAWAGSGGGISDHWARPAWQVGKGLPAGNKRASADVSMNADPYTGYSFYFEGNWSRIGGTSASAPTFAALWVLTVEATGRRVGGANAYLYQLGNSSSYGRYFYDVTKGNNGAGRGPGYQTGPNWDPPSGWGAPEGTEIVNWMVKVSRPRTN